MASGTQRPTNQSEAAKHRSSLLRKLVTLRDNKELCDVVIIVEKREFHAHKNILSASSDYFRTMFTSEFQEKNLDEIELEGTSASFDRLLGFAYSGHLKLEDLSTTDAIDTLNMAAYLQLEHAVMLVSQCLLRAIECELENLAEVYRIWELADLLGKGMGIEELASTALDFLARHFIQYSQLESFKSNTSVEFLKKCLQKNSLAALLPGREDVGGKEKDAEKKEEAAADLEKEKTGMQGVQDEVFLERQMKEERILDIVTSWLFHDLTQRQVYAHSLLQTLRLRFLGNSKVLRELMDTAIGSMTDCRQLLERWVTCGPCDEESSNEFFKPRGIVKAPVLLHADENIHVYNRKLCRWKEITSKFAPEMYLPRYSCIGIKNHLYVCGGISRHGVSGSKFCRYDLTDDPKQLVLSKMTHPRCDCAMVHLDHHIYVIAGVESRVGEVDHETRRVERYDTNMVRYDSIVLEERKDPWISLEDIPGACWRPHGVAYKGKVLCCGLSEYPRARTAGNRFIDIQVDGIGDIEYVLYMYDPGTDRWQQHVLMERPIIDCMMGKANFVKLLVHNGECYLVGTMEVPAEANPSLKWFRLTVNKLVFEEDGQQLRFKTVGEALSQDMFNDKYFSAYFYIGSDVFYNWGNNLFHVPDLKITDSDFKEKADTLHVFPNNMSRAFAMAEVDIQYLGDQ